MIYVRYEALVPDTPGRLIGIFAMANGLAKADHLTPSDWAWWRANNDWFNAACTNPTTVNPRLFDKTQRQPHICWFKSTAVHLLDRVPGYIELLGRYEIDCTTKTSSDPGRVIYSDSDQVVVVPFEQPQGRRAEPS